MKRINKFGIDRFLDRRAEGALRLSLFVLLLLAVVILARPAAAPAQVSVGLSVTIAPPAIPIYSQPLCPGHGYIWVPGFWAWDPDYGYYWVPGMWERAPFVGALWTPGYWGWNNGFYVWYDGYWGPVVGFYGGINYGFGYHGHGYVGGHWRGNDFYYNRTVNKINVTNITNVYSEPVRTVRPSGPGFNGGSGGTSARPTSEQLAAADQKRATLTDFQKEQMRVARDNPRQRATVNRGRPTVAATEKPGEFSGKGVVRASRAGAPYKASPTARTAETGERVRAPGSSAERRPKAATSERMAPGSSRKEAARMAPRSPMQEPERRYQEPRTVPKRPEMAQPLAPQGRSRGPSEMRPPATAPERMTPRGAMKESERRVQEPRSAPQRPETAEPSQQHGKSRGGRD